MNRRGQRGEAAVEWIGVVIAVALLGAALTAWMPAAVRPPERPPDVIAAVAEPLRRAPAQLGRAGLALPALAAMARANESPARRALRWAVARSAPALVLGRDMAAAYGAGYLGRLRERVDRFAGDPAAEFSDIDMDALTIPGMLRAIADELPSDPAAIRAYLRRIRAMPARDAAVEVAGDAGSVAADATVEAAEIVVKRWLLRGILGRGGRS